MDLMYAESIETFSSLMKFWTRKLTACIYFLKFNSKIPRLNATIFLLKLHPVSKECSVWSFRLLPREEKSVAILMFLSLSLPPPSLTTFPNTSSFDLLRAKWVTLSTWWWNTSEDVPDISCSQTCCDNNIRLLIRRS